MKEKRSFTVCEVCRHDVKGERGIRVYCYHCKKIEKVAIRFLFSAEVADSTGSINVRVYSEEISLFISTTAEDYAAMT